MGLDMNKHIKISWRTTIITGFTFTRETKLAAGVYTCRDLYGNRLVKSDFSGSFTFEARMINDMTTALTIRAGCPDGKKTLRT
jgi:hypothetical protein